VRWGVVVGFYWDLPGGRWFFLREDGDQLRYASLGEEAGTVYCKPGFKLALMCLRREQPSSHRRFIQNAAA